MELRKRGHWRGWNDPGEPKKPLGLPTGRDGGRYRTRTDDLFRVKEARYQLRQSPCTIILPHAPTGHGHPKHVARRRALPAHDWPIRIASDRVPKHAEMWAVRMWRSGSASPCQGEGREFESRHPLEIVSRGSYTWCGKPHMVAWPRGEAAACKAVHTGSNPVATSAIQ